MIGRGHRLLANCVVAASAVWAAVTPVLAQSDGPIVIREAEKPPLFFLERPTATLLLEGTYSRSTTRDIFEKTAFEDLRLDQTLTLATTGHVVHPSVLDMNLEGSFGLSEIFSNSGDATDSQFGTLYEYDTRFNFFQPRPLSASVYAKRDRYLLDRSFGPTVENTTNSYGIAGDLRLGTYTSHLEAFNATSQLRSRGDPLSDFDYTENTILWNNRYLPVVNQEITWDYTFTDAEQTSSDFDTQTQKHDARIQHLWRFGESNRSTLTSILHGYNLTGTYDQQYLTWEERLRLYHSRTLETNYRYLYDVRTSGGIDRTRHRATASFTHRLYESLTTIGEIGYEKAESGDSAGEDEYFGTIDFDYRKIVPYGTLTASMGLGYDSRNTDEGATRAPVEDLPTVIANGPVGIVLSDPQVRADTIIITDPSGLRFYRLGIDYDVVERAGSVEVRPIVGGALTPGTLVLLDYGFSPVPANTTDSTKLSLNARYAIEEGPLKGLSLYGRYFQQEQSVDSADPSLFLPNSFQDTLAGIEYKIGDFTFTVEQEWRTGDVYPFDATRFSAKWETFLFSETALLLNASYYLFDYPEEDNHVELLTVSAQVRQRIFERCSLNATVLWRDERDDTFGRSSAFDQQVDVEWRFRQFTLFLRARSTFLDGEDRSSSYQEAYIGIQRDF